MNPDHRSGEVASANMPYIDGVKSYTLESAKLPNRGSAAGGLNHAEGVHRFSAEGGFKWF